MYKNAFLILALFNFATCEEKRKDHFIDPFAALDKHLSHSIAHHYLWPWSELIRAAATLDLEESLEDPKILSSPDKYQISLNVRRFKPEELKIKVKNKYIIVEGKHKETDDIKKFMANHFVQRFVLPPGTKQEEVDAILTEKGVLLISAPKHELPPPPPEREVPITVILPVTTEKPAEVTEKVEETTKAKEPEQTASPIEQVESEATTHVGKIRKKELKTTTKTTKYNEVTKGIEGNGLDYALIESDE